MPPEFDRVVIQGEVIFERTSIFASSTGEIAWITDIESDHVRVETVTDCLRIPMEKFRTRIVDDDYILEAPPAGHSKTQ